MMSKRPVKRYSPLLISPTTAQTVTTRIECMVSVYVPVSMELTASHGRANGSVYLTLFSCVSMCKVSYFLHKVHNILLVNLLCMSLYEYF